MLVIGRACDFSEEGVNFRWTYIASLVIVLPWKLYCTMKRNWDGITYKKTDRKSDDQNIRCSQSERSYEWKSRAFTMYQQTGHTCFPVPVQACWRNLGRLWFALWQGTCFVCIICRIINNQAWQLQLLIVLLLFWKPKYTIRNSWSNANHMHTILS